MSLKSYLVHSMKLGISADQALRNLGFGGGSNSSAENNKSNAANNKSKVQVNQSYSSQEFADKGDQGSEFFNQTKQRGTLFGN